MTYFQELKDQAVLVTGGSKGIGKDIAMAFAKLGSHVIITGRNEADLNETLSQLQEIHPDCKAIVCDMQKTDEVIRMVDEAYHFKGKLDVVVNNAGTNIPTPVLEVTEEQWDTIMDTNLKGLFFCSQRAGKYMTAARKGSIIQIVSQLAFVGFHNRSVYGASKGGVVQLTKAMAIEWAPYNVKVNAVAPTFIQTELTSQFLKDPDFKRDVLSRIPLGELAQVSDVTGAVLFLASDLARFITGETIKVDGGWTAI